jgi:hypothetical protein
MSSFQQSAAAAIDERLNDLAAQLCELERLREQVRKAELARRSLRLERGWVGGLPIVKQGASK